MSIQERLTREVCKIIEANSITIICDYGCGSGELLRNIQKTVKRKLKLFGVDYFSSMPKELRPVSDDEIIYIEKDTEAFYALINCETKFDLITSTFALHHFKLPVKELKTIVSMLVPQGFLFVADPLFCNDNNSQRVKNISSFIGEALASFRGMFHRHHYSVEEARDLISSVALNIVHTQELTLAISDDELDEDTKHSLQHIDTVMQLIPNFQNPILEEYFRMNLEFEKKITSQYKIDFSRLFIIICQRSN